MSKRKPPKWRTSKDPEDRLIVAADNWLKARGGEGIVAGPICIVSEPYESEQKFIIGVKMYGKKPTKVEDSEKLISERANIPLEPDTEYLMKYLADQYSICTNERSYGAAANYLEGVRDGQKESSKIVSSAELMGNAQTLVSLLNRFAKK